MTIPMGARGVDYLASGADAAESGRRQCSALDAAFADLGVRLAGVYFERENDQPPPQRSTFRALLKGARADEFDLVGVATRSALASDANEFTAALEALRGCACRLLIADEHVVL